MRDFPDVTNLPFQRELSDPFTTFHGRTVETPEEWHEERRPELRALFQQYMYGYVPDPPSISIERGYRDDDLFGGQATLAEITIRFDDHPPSAPSIDLLAIVPNDRTPAPTFLGLNKCGNHTILDHPGITIDERAWRHENCDGVDDRGAKADFWCVERLIERGYAFTTFHESDVDPDRPDFTDGVHPHFDPHGTSESGWGTLAAWAWGLSRAIDYLESDEAIAEIATIGHSRRGKAALLAGALDDRVDLVVPHQSGTGGCAISRDNAQETVERINEVYPHWFCDCFERFNDNEAKLPFDQHFLLALVAPRPLLDTEGEQDIWSNPPKALEAVQAAAPVWEFLGADGMVGDGLVGDGEDLGPENCGDIVQYRRDTGHMLDRGYWEAILDFADIQFADEEGELATLRTPHRPSRDE